MLAQIEPVCTCQERNEICAPSGYQSSIPGFIYAEIDGKVSLPYVYVVLEAFFAPCCALNPQIHVSMLCALRCKQQAYAPLHWKPLPSYGQFSFFCFFLSHWSYLQLHMNGCASLALILRPNTSVAGQLVVREMTIAMQLVFFAWETVLNRDSNFLRWFLQMSGKWNKLRHFARVQKNGRLARKGCTIHRFLFWGKIKKVYGKARPTGWRWSRSLLKHSCFWGQWRIVLSNALEINAQEGKKNLDDKSLDRTRDRTRDQKG